MASIYKSRDRWTAQVNLDGKRRSKTFDRKVDATRWARREESAQDTTGSVTTAPARARFNDVITAYLDEMGEGSSKSKLGTIAHISELIGRTPVDDLDVKAFTGFAKQREAEGAGPSTIGQDLSYIHTLLSVGGPLAGIPVTGALVAQKSARSILNASGRVARPTERKRRPSDAELIALRDNWARTRRLLPIWDITLFAICTTMRLSEITRIKWDDLDTEARTVIIRDRKHPRAKKGSDHVVPLLRGPVTIGGEIIDPMEIINRQHRIGDEIFPFSPATISTTFTRGVTACGIDDLRFHDLRHDGVSRLFEADYRIEQVSLVSGHQDWQMLRRYTQINAGSLHRD